MTHSLEAITTTALGVALDAAQMRQQVIAANIANANVGGYAAQRLSFDAVLSETWSRDGASVRPVSVQATVAPALDASGQPVPVQLDAEMAQLSVTQLQYQALVKGLNRHFAVLQSAITDGKR